jgi:hypothetical protein
MTCSVSTSAMTWEFRDGVATLAANDLLARVDVARPEAGCYDVRFRDETLNLAQWLAVSPAAKSRVVVEDLFTRGGDLVATYAETPDWPLRWQVYWRVLSGEAIGPALAGLELIVSAQTSMLDCSPALVAQTRLSGPSSLISREEGGIVSRLSAAELSYVELIHPADHQGTDIQSTGGQITLRHPLFLKSLEKGVILRARLRGLLVRASEAETAADACARLFRDSPTPLTV